MLLASGEDHIAGIDPQRDNTRHITREHSHGYWRVGTPVVTINGRHGSAFAYVSTLLSSVNESSYRSKVVGHGRRYGRSSLLLATP